MRPDIPGYIISDMIGEGGLAKVYMAEHLKFRHKVAVKVLRKEFAANENVRKRFLAEARTLFRLSHTNLLKVTDLIEEDDLVAFVMEYIEGLTLKQHIDNDGVPSEDKLRNLMFQLLDVLGFIHSSGLVHRDIKPSNIMIGRDLGVKLLDFGIAKSLDQESSDYTQTHTNQLMGTPMYMSPEQILETKSVTPASDIYSLGVVLWQTVTGRKPYDMKTLSDFQLKSKIVNETLPLTGTVWDDMIQRATDKDVEKRFKDCREWRDQFMTGESIRKNTTSSIIRDDVTVFESGHINSHTASKEWKHAGDFYNDLVIVEGGTFKMGCSDIHGIDCSDKEAPAHVVRLSTYMISSFPVTEKQWELVMGMNPSHVVGEEDCPVENVSWYDIHAFIWKLNTLTGGSFRLPTEAEWEYAARGGLMSKGYAYSGSNDPNEVGWMDMNSGVAVTGLLGGLADRKKHPVGLKLPNELGLYDMSGNVWEWCKDWYGEYMPHNQIDPQGPDFGEEKILRGGSWSRSPFNARVSCRVSVHPDSRSYTCGFRLAHPYG
jgi:serine/threonine protein kinase